VNGQAAMATGDRFLSPGKQSAQRSLATKQILH
jgi:hypothetical protein